MNTRRNEVISKQREAAMIAMSFAEGVEVAVMKANGQELTDAVRDEMLERCAAGKHVELEMLIDAYQQKAGVRNRNNVRIADTDLVKFAKTGKQRPFLKDHDQNNTMSKAGVIIQSVGEDVDGTFNVKLTVKITALWAVDLALRGLLDTVSVSWRAQGAVKCSACDEQIFVNCWHTPGVRLTEKIIDGKKYLARDPNGTIVVQWVYHDPEMLECSFVPVPAVPTSRIDTIRNSLAEVLSADELDSSPVLLSQDLPKESVVMSDTNHEVAALTAKNVRLEKIVALTGEEKSFYDRLSNDSKESFLGMSRKDRQDMMTPIHTTPDGVKFFACDDPRMIEMAKSSEATVKLMTEQLAAERARSMTVRAEAELAHLPGTAEVRVALLSAVEAIEKPEIREAALKAIKDYDGKQATQFVRQGGSNARPAASVDAETKIQQLADKYAEEHDVGPEVAYNAVMETEEGMKLYAQAEAAKRSQPHN